MDFSFVTAFMKWSIKREPESSSGFDKMAVWIFAQAY
jgi:hypothetical protein